MKKFDLRLRIFVPIAIVFALLVILSGFWIIQQTRTRSDNFHDQLVTMAMTSRFTIHSSAAEFARSKGLIFHRIVEGRSIDGNIQTTLINEARRAFESNRSLEVITKEITENGDTRLYALSPARLQDGCRMCHNSNGRDLFPGKMNGEMVALFGVSGSTKEVKTLSNYLWLVVFGLGFLAFLLIAVSIFNIVEKKINKPLNEILISSEGLAEGDFTKKIQVKGDDEIGKLGQTFNSMVTNINAIMSEVLRAMNEMATSTMKMASSTEEMASGTEEQSAQTAEVATAMDEISHTITENARNAAILAETVRESKHAADQGGEAVKNTIESVRNIGSSVQNFTTSILSLGTSSGQIGEIVTVINDIADQTNLLALNAAIEAARAGEHGRGFAVVADEVRKLAERTVKATKEIESMIKRIQEDSAAAVSNLEQGIGAVESGIEQAEQAGIMLDGIVDISGAVVDVVAQMASTSEEQSTTGEEIAKNLQAISVVTQQTSNGVQEIARTTGELTRLSKKILELLSNLKINSGSRQDLYFSDSFPSPKADRQKSERGRLLSANRNPQTN